MATILKGGSRDPTTSSYTLLKNVSAAWQTSAEPLKEGVSGFMPVLVELSADQARTFMP